jgi:DNA-binding CsgD family transcriptional regulator
MSISRADILWLSDLLQQVYAARTPAELAACATSALSRRLRVVYSGCEEFSRSGSDMTLHGVTTSVPPVPDWQAHIHDHPVLPLLRNLPALSQVRRMVSRAEFERTDYYNGVARQMGWNDNIILRVQGEPTAVTLSVFRDRVFTRQEADLLLLAEPHLAVAWRRVAAPARALLVAGERRLRLSADLQPVGFDPSLVARLRLYFPGWRESARLPKPVHDWAAAMRAELRAVPPPRPLRTLMVAQACGTLFVSYFPLAGTGAVELRFMERPAELRRWSSALNLSLREREVLHWLGEGKRDSEIAVILGIAPRTVTTRVERVLAKLGVKNRTAAAAMGAPA